jgi:hypothetical protein
VDQMDSSRVDTEIQRLEILMGRLDAELGESSEAERSALTGGSSISSGSLHEPADAVSLPSAASAFSYSAEPRPCSAQRRAQPPQVPVAPGTDTSSTVSPRQRVATVAPAVAMADQLDRNLQVHLPW